MANIKTILNVLAYCVSLLGVAPVFFYIDMAPRLIFALSLICGFAFDRKERYPLHGLPSVLISLLFFIFYASRFSRENLIVPAASILVILLSVRLISEKNGRNYLQILAISLFALAGSSLLSLSMMFILYLVLFLLFVAIFLVFLTFSASSSRQAISAPDLKKILAVSLLMPAASIPLLLLFFVILPRTQFPLWHFLNSPGQKMAGFSERVEPGAAAQVNEAKNVVFRAQSDRLADSDLYWRGIVLNAIQGKAWVRSAKRLPDEASAAKGRVIRQTVYPEPSANPFLVALDLPQRIDGVRVNRENDHVFRKSDSRPGRLRFEATSILTDSIRTRLTGDRGFYLETPARLSARMVSLAAQLAGKGKTDQDKIAALKEFFARQKYAYSTRNLPRSADPIDEFLFEKKAGHCEFFASSFATLLRLMGVPSRLVGGYHGGEYNTIGGYYVVTEDMAHVWVEAYLQDRGWLKIDPTEFAVNYARPGQSHRIGLFKKLQLISDSFSYYWNQAVINYDLEKQVRILRQTNDLLQGARFSFKPGKLLYALPVLIIAVLAIGAKKWRRSSPEERLVKAFVKKVRKKYPEAAITPATGLMELADIVDESAVRQFADVYCAAIYRDRKLTGSEFRLLRRLVAQL